jgi:hypothetical protein
MIVKYLFSSPNGDIPSGPKRLLTPFKMTPSENHPILTLADYFSAIKDFIFKDPKNVLIPSLDEELGKTVVPTQIHKILIRSEKHGALYHLASVEIFIEHQSVKRAVSTAVTEKAKRWLSREYDLLEYLGDTFKLPYLPKVHFKGDVDCNTKNGKTTLSMFMAQWFENYYEWHITMDKKVKRQRICIWNMEEGYRLASKKESHEIFRQASKILTLYYDTKNFRQIYPWHHGAGDFVVKTKDGKIDVKLTTARRYEPIMASLEEAQIHPLVAMIYFFLNLTLKMRLDKMDGIGEIAWAEDLSVKAATQGFFDALKIMEATGRYNIGKIEELFNLLNSFTQKELYKLFNPLLELYRDEDPDDLAIIERNLKNHTKELYQIIQRFHL